MLLLVSILIELNNLIENTNDEVNRGLLNALIFLEQQLDNSKCKIDAWKKKTLKSETAGRSQTMTSKDMLKHLIAIGLKKDIAKMLNVGRILVA